MLSTSFKTEEFLKITDINKRKLRYWIDNKLIYPHKKSTGRGINTEFNTENLVHLYIIRELADSGLTTRAIKHIMQEVRRCDLNSLPDTIIATNGKDFTHIAKEINFQDVFKINPLYIMRIRPLFNKALRDMELFENETFNKEDYYGFNRN